ncbi:unnamed protein product [Durusdinium trenchii]|uniref:Uncharacterized protein n=1 Tax=Durusdinium trenchii TaxID=1381693 RepID=A0ABP0LH27_9DINO
MGCALSSAADHAVARATQRVEKDQVIEKAAQGPMRGLTAVHRAMQAAVLELNQVEVSLQIAPKGAGTDVSPGSFTSGAASHHSGAASPCSPCSPGSTAARFAEQGLRRGRAADWCASRLNVAAAVLITEEGWSRFFYYPFASIDDATEVFHSWPHTARILYHFDASSGMLTRELLCHGGASLGLSIPNIRSRAEALLVD